MASRISCDMSRYSFIMSRRSSMYPACVSRHCSMASLCACIVAWCSRMWPWRSSSVNFSIRSRLAALLVSLGSGGPKSPVADSQSGLAWPNRSQSSALAPAVRSPCRKARRSSAPMPRSASRRAEALATAARCCAASRGVMFASAAPSALAPPRPPRPPRTSGNMSVSAGSCEYGLCGSSGSVGVSSCSSRSRSAASRCFKTSTRSRRPGMFALPLCAIS
mmetsp:Transcript_20500/g.69486  ORF Transcript_20500/g.69486 Transcript_20500/m.69486 type:complete len:220 (+) Transcript_20500:122-781(+)